MPFLESQLVIWWYEIFCIFCNTNFCQYDNYHGCDHVVILSLTMTVRSGTNTKRQPPKKWKWAEQTLNPSCLIFWSLLNSFKFATYKWAGALQNQQNDMCAQRRLGSVWASAQSDQSLPCALYGWSDWAASALSDLSLLWVHRACWFCHALAYFKADKYLPHNSRNMTKPTQWVHPAKTQISRGIPMDARADLSLRWAHSHIVGFIMSWLILFFLH